MKRRDFLRQVGVSTLMLSGCQGHFALGAQKPLESEFEGIVALGCPTDRSIKINILSQDDWDIVLEYGHESGIYNRKTGIFPSQAHAPLEVELVELSPDTQYYYRILASSPNRRLLRQSPEYRFHTQRLPGSTFTFCVQGDSHPERHKKAFDEQLYDRTLRTALGDRPDFYIMMGDDFSVDTIKPNEINADLVAERYLLQRYYLSALSHSTPLYLVNGNHEQAARYLLDGRPDNIAVWAQGARNLFYPQPVPDSFYTGNEEPVEFIGHLENYYAWTWGDALFVTLDPYWSSPVPVDNVYGGGPKTPDKWDITLGEVQYRWLKQTLEQSTARWKFVSTHHIHGTGRGGVEVAGFYEWGGHTNKGVWEFDRRRPGWDLPVHQLMVKHGVTIFFQGHDHVFARQELDDVTYLTTPCPADPNYAAANASRFLSGDVLPGSGYTRVTVNDASVQIEYVRTFLPGDED
ncbi:MAG: metallophosphoesterase family protein, partial [Planctomycetota bacterium]